MKSIEYLDETHFLKDDEIAICLRKNNIFSLGTSIKKLLSFYHFYYFISIEQDGYTYDIYRDNLENVLVIKYRILLKKYKLESEHHEKENAMLVCGSLIDHKSELFHSSGHLEIINLSKLVDYSNNVFPKAIERIKRGLKEKQKELKKMYV